MSVEALHATASTGVPEAVGLQRHLAMDATNTALEFKYSTVYVDEWDEMFGIPSTGVVLSKFCWFESLAGSGTYSVVAGSSKHMGVIRATTGTTSGNANRAFLGSSASTTVLLASDLKRIFFRVSVGTITSVTVAYGCGTDISAANLGTASVYFVFDPATDSHWQFVVRNASTSSTQTSNVTVNAGDWYDLEATFDGTHWTPTINGAASSL